MSTEFVTRHRRALGLPLTDETDPCFSESDVSAIEDVKHFVEAGLEEEGVEDVTRVAKVSRASIYR